MIKVKSNNQILSILGLNRKRILTVFLLLISIIAHSTPVESLSTLTELENFKNPENNQVVIVTDEFRGGVFQYYSRATNKVDGGIVLKSRNNGVWKRLYVQDKINVQWFGALPGNQNVSNSIQNIVDHYDNITLWFPNSNNAATYNFGGITISNKKNITISGLNTNLKLANGSTSLFTFSNVANATVTDLVMDGNFSQTPDSLSNKFALIRFFINDSSIKGNYTITNNTFKNVKTASLFISNLNNELSKTFFGIGAEVIRINNNNFFNYGIHSGIALRGAHKEVWIQNNYFTDPSHRHFNNKTLEVTSELANRADGSRNVHILGNTFYDILQNGIFCQFVHNLQISDNMGYELGADSVICVFIKIDDLEGNAEVTNNMCKNFHNTESWAFMIQSSGPVGDTRISKDVLIANNSFGLAVYLGGDGHYLFTGNKIFNKGSLNAKGETITPPRLLFIATKDCKENLIYSNIIEVDESDKIQMTTNRGIEIKSNDNIVTNNVIRGARKQAIYLNEAQSGNVIDNNYIEQFPGCLGGIYLSNIKEAQVVNNFALGNNAVRDIYLVGGDTADIRIDNNYNFNRIVQSRYNEQKTKVSNNCFLKNGKKESLQLTKNLRDKVWQLDDSKTPTLSVNQNFYKTPESGSTITYFNNGEVGQVIKILCSKGTKVVNNPSKIVTSTNANLVLKNKQLLSFVLMDDGVWYQQN